MTGDATIHHTKHHCRSVQFKVRLSEGLSSAHLRTCSLCRMRDAIAVSANLDNIEITAG